MNVDIGDGASDMLVNERRHLLASQAAERDGVRGGRGRGGDGDGDGAGLLDDGADMERGYEHPQYGSSDHASAGAPYRAHR